MLMPGAKSWPDMSREESCARISSKKSIIITTSPGAKNINSDEFWVVRKGATPAFPGQKSFVGGSMGDDAVIIEGIDSPISRQALFSTVHGAGRIMSRTAARGRFERVGNKRIRRAGLVQHDEMMKWMADRNIVLRGGDVDEAPQVYRRLRDVLDAHAGTIRVLHTLRPLGVAMAGRGIVDPYKKKGI